MHSPQLHSPQLHSPQLHIRPATPADASALTRLMAQLGYETDLKRLEHMIYVADSDSETIVVAEVNDQLVALLSLVYFDYLPAVARYARITALVVEHSHQGQGIGTELLAHARLLATEQDCVCLEVTSSEVREQAAAFYEKSGFHRTSYKFALPLT
ncbi:GNAT family N-acetyltransferase [Photobacterium sp. 1_MG-2023]|uniref:GNAT family N-acetyltransferase n=1 Tax=Photobacterium sp. 1_MG-2023 TaxID=3062646 RepID=UPI0026E43C79|nr:GNAT family N-acetyltransferase [Photobacterium sp. 1_MG-2023]MDO6708422.1 GNAT family N-acetyltransferase [Photobacterium sp. 1_MG-2023]